MTKVMNEGWASYWHSTLMTKHFVDAREIIDYADHHSGTVHMPPGNFNPYKIGIELFRDIEDRWNKGKFGKEYDEAKNLGAPLELVEWVAEHGKLPVPNFSAGGIAI